MIPLRPWLDILDLQMMLQLACSSSAGIIASSKKRLDTQAQFTKGLVRHQVPAWHNQAVCTSAAQQGPEPMLFTSYLANGHLRSLRPTNESYPLSWMEPVLLQGPPLWIYRQQDHCCFCCSLQWLLLLMFILSFYPLKHIKLTHQHAYTHARCCLSASKMSDISLRIHTATQTQDAPFNGESSRVVFFFFFFLHAVYILFILVQSPTPYFASLPFSSFAFSLSVSTGT